MLCNSILIHEYIVLWSKTSEDSYGLASIFILVAWSAKGDNPSMHFSEQKLSSPSSLLHQLGKFVIHGEIMAVSSFFIVLIGLFIPHVEYRNRPVWVNATLEMINDFINILLRPALQFYINEKNEVTNGISRKRLKQ